MTKPPRASIVFYDEETQQLKMCTVLRSRVQSTIDQAMAVTIPPDAAEHSREPITDEDARKLGGMLMLMQGFSNPDLRERLQFKTDTPVDWNPPTPPRD
ncbi:conserved hypothetical protein [Paraburkholderia piptadeniae]|uniref:Uncharacterized protein n=1 Tax=Paraburkholderia piptadeniae TaxID=1701573 RepID=A0A1N7SF47_9BURK|nr:hypothetical protein [Paraburkholderia piptadeniae]SIT45991.1 conserved hypothetical protein [Paraburkholderia piptadeniae]